MENRLAKTVDESRTTQVQILMPGQLNGYDRLFGGKLMEWIDVLAAVVARRHSNCNVTTACIDHLTFKAAAFANETILLKGQITYAGRTSMEVRVDTFVESLEGDLRHINRAYLVLVAIDKDGKPVPVPKLILNTDEEREEYEAAKLRNEYRKAH